MRRITLLRAASTWIGVIPLAFAPGVAVSQQPGAAPSVASRDSVTVVAGPMYKAGSLHRSLFGGVYRDVWTTPIRVPVLDLRTTAGGLRPTKEGGGQQTKSLHMVSA